ncbi:hypothetical protein [Pedobacter sp. KBW06]|uniref:hypothetical protein n=1 Tax=Pedobacter sp. KBW06 TaxID=2153359 RepID=UPI001F3BC561|nr:hypothetical protein [Pedobacter sp. KBW06]
MNSPRRWHGWDIHLKSFPAAEALPESLDWDLWQMATTGHNYNKDFVNGQWRCWFDFGMGALGDWGAHILDTAHEFLDLGLPYQINPVLEGHNDFFFPTSSTLAFKFPKRGDMPALDVNWYDGINNLPPSTGAIAPAKLNPGKIIYSKELTFKGGSHGSTLSIIPEEKAKAMAGRQAS